jgi:hypothetical protein
MKPVFYMFSMTGVMTGLCVREGNNLRMSYVICARSATAELRLQSMDVNLQNSRSINEAPFHHLNCTNSHSLRYRSLETVYLWNLASAITRDRVMLYISHVVYLIYQERPRRGEGRKSYAIAWRQSDPGGNTIMQSRVFQQPRVR